MKFLFLSLFLFSITVEASVKRLAQDLKLPTQALMHKQTFTDPGAADTTGVLNANAGATNASPVTVTTGLTNPTTPRNLVITPGTSTVDVAACVITVSGTNIFGTSITSAFTFSNNQSAAVTGDKAFKTITSVAFPANCEDGNYAATWSIGKGEKLGLDRCMDNVGDLVFSTVAGAYESTRAVTAVNASSIESNTIDFNGTMDGSNDFNAYYIENFRCKP